MAPEIGRIEDEDDGIRLRDAGHYALQDVVRHTLVFRLRSQTVYAGQIHQVYQVPVFELRGAGAMLDGDTRKIRDLLPQSGEAIEERRLAGVGRPNDRHRDLALAG